MRERKIEEEKEERRREKTRSRLSLQAVVEEGKRKRETKN